MGADGVCRTFDQSQSILFPNILGDGRGVTNTPADPAPAIQPRTPAYIAPNFDRPANPLPSTPAQAAAMEAEEELWFGYEPWKVLLVTGGTLFGIYYATQQAGVK